MVIQPVRYPTELRIFQSLPWAIYRDDPHWVPPLLREERRLLNGGHPFFEQAAMQAFLLSEGKEVIGRICAIHDRHHLAVHGDGVGFFGFFECRGDIDAARVLLDTARAWLRARGLGRVRGPVNPSMHFPCGLLVDGFDAPPTFLMPYNPPGYAALLEGCGLVKATDLLAFTLEVWKEPPPKVLRAVEVARRRGIRARPINLASLKQEVALFRDIFNSAWRANWGFTPMTEGEADWMAEHLRPLILPELALIAEGAAGPVGFLMLLPDYNQAIRHLKGRLGPVGLLKFFWYRRHIRDVRLLLFGIREGYRGQGIDALLFLSALEPLRRFGYQRCEVSWVLEQNRPVRQMATHLGGVESKRYRIYEGAV